MTRQEKKEELIGLFAVGAIFIGDLIDECFEFGQQHPRWISVKDDLPKMECDFDTWSCSDEVLVFTPIGDYCIRRLKYDKRDDRFYWEPRTANVTHWMPLPALPEHIAGVSKMIGSSEKPNNCDKGDQQ